MHDDKIRCLVSDAHGIYAWQAFVTNYDPTEWHVQVEDLRTLEAGPGDPNYWEATTNVEMEASYRDEDGHAWHLYQDGDIFAIRDDLTDVEFREVFP